jgi:hypothetical protein
MINRLHLKIAAASLAVVSMLACGRGTQSSAPVSLTLPGRSSATPWVAASGSFVAVAFGATNASGTDVFVAVSRDAGRTFSSPNLVNAIAGEARLGGEFPPRVALTARDGPKDPEVAVLWTARGTSTEIKTARSRDGGRTFDTPVTLQAIGAAGTRGWPALTLDQQGTAHSIWLDHRGMAATAHSEGNHPGHRAAVPQDGVAAAQKSGLYYASAGGASTGEHELTKGVCYCCKTALVAGADGTLYAAWRHVYAGNLRDMALTVSRDGGRTFSEPVRVSEDRWAINGCPDDGPAMAVDKTGVAHLVWPTVIDGPQPQGGIFYATTRDGKQFTARVRIPTLGSPKPSHPQIVVDRAGRVVVAWDELIEGRRVAAAREVKVQPDGTAMFGDPIDLATGESGVYPVLAASDQGLVAVWTTGSGEQSAVRARTLTFP